MPAGRAVVDCTRQTKLATNLVSMYQDVSKKCKMSSLMLVVSDKSRVLRNFDGFDRLCSKVVATRSARKQN